MRETLSISRLFTILVIMPILAAMPTVVCGQNDPPPATPLDLPDPDAPDPDGNLELPEPSDVLAAAQPPNQVPMTISAVLLASVPNMIGDFYDLGGNKVNFTFFPDDETGNNPSNMVNIPAVGGAGRRQKISENFNGQPRNRLFVNYHYFDNVIGGIGDVNRYTFGFESTYWDGTGSFEFRLPFASTLATNQALSNPLARDSEFGNLNLIWKHLLYNSDRCLCSAGMGFGFPTADAVQIQRISGATMLRIENQAYRVRPFIGVSSVPSDLFFWQAFCQLDFDVNGNSVYENGTEKIGVMQDATILFADLSGGIHVYDNPYSSLLRHIAAIGELHYSGSLQDADFVQGSNFALGSIVNRFDVLNATAGFSCLVGERTIVRPAIVVPLATGRNHQFDYEALLQVNTYF